MGEIGYEIRLEGGRRGGRDIYLVDWVRSTLLGRGWGL